MPVERSHGEAGSVNAHHSRPIQDRRAIAMLGSGRRIHDVVQEARRQRSIPPRQIRQWRAAQAGWRFVQVAFIECGKRRTGVIDMRNTDRIEQPAHLEELTHGALIIRSEEHTSELQSHLNLVCRLLLEKKKKNKKERSTVDNWNSLLRKDRR